MAKFGITRIRQWCYGRSSPLAPNHYDRSNCARRDEASNEFGFVRRVFKVGGSFIAVGFPINRYDRVNCAGFDEAAGIWVRSSRFPKRPWVRSEHSCESVGSFERCKFRPVPFEGCSKIAKVAHSLRVQPSTVSQRL